MNDLISVVISTYDRPDALDRCLRALAHQRDRHFEIIVADDGSGPETARIVKSWQSRLTAAVQHVWHEQKGFRAAEIRNHAIRASVGQYCIFLDGDCLAPPDFVGTHRRLAEPGWFVAGNRILLSKKLTDAVLVRGLPVETWNLAKLAREWLRGGVNRLLPALRLPLGRLRKLRRHAWQGAKSSNLAVARRDLDIIDGFDARYVGWGREDSDLVIRLLHAGVCRKDGRFATGVIHLWHPLVDRSHLPENELRLKELLASKRVRAMQGLSVV